MAYLGRKGVSAPLTSTDVPSDLVLTGSRVTVPTTATASARDAAITSPQNGMLTYNTEAGAVQQYNGAWSTIAPAPLITSVSGFLNDDSDSTLTIFGSNFNSNSSVKMFSASAGGTQIGTNATTTFNSKERLTAVFGSGSIGASGSVAYIEVDNVGLVNRFGTAITVNADPTSVHAGATGTGANTTTHLGTYGGSVAGGGADANTILLLNFDRADGSTDFEDSSNIGKTGHKITATGDAHIDTANSIYKFGTANGKTNNSSAYFDGSDSLSIANSSSMGGQTGFTYDFWVYPTSSSANQVLFEQGDGGSSNALVVSVYRDTNTKINATFYINGVSDSTNGGAKYITTNNVPINTWTHVAMSRVAGSTQVLHYINGKYDGAQTLSGTGVLRTNGSAMLIGAGGGTDFIGYIDSFRWSNTNRYSGTSTASNWANFSEITSIYGANLSKTLPTITLTGSASAGLASDEDIEFTAVENSGKADGSRSLIDTDIGLTLTNLTDSDKNKATLTGTIASSGVSHTNMPMKLQVRKTITGTSYANASKVVTVTSSAGLAPAMVVSGTGIPANATIASVDSATTFTLSADSTSAGTDQTLIFLDPDRISHINGSDTLSNSDTMLTIASGSGGSNVLFHGRRYEGNTTGLRQITGFGLKPDLVWFKDRDTQNSAYLYDSVRGIGKHLIPHDTAAESSLSTNGLSEFLADGVKLGKAGTGDSNVSNSINRDASSTMVWAWKAGGAPNGVLVGSGATMSGTSGAGSIDNAATGVVRATAITQSVSQTSGLSITKFYGHADGVTIPHNLGSTPAMIIVKVSSGNAGQNWIVWHKDLTAVTTKYLVLDNNSAEGTDSNGWSVAPSSTVITTGSSNPFGGNTWTYMMYAWKAVAGVSAFGTWEGAGNATSRTITGMGFSPRWIMIKNRTASGSWQILDLFRGFGTSADTGKTIAADSYALEVATGPTITPTSDGITFATSNAILNTGSQHYIYMAFA